MTYPLEYAITLILGIGCVLSVVSYLRVRTQQTQSTADSLQIRDRLEALQQALLTHQQTTNLNYDAKSAELRSELAQALKLNREELQNGLLASSRTLAARVDAIDARLDQRLGQMSQNVQSHFEKTIKEGAVQFEKVQGHLNAASLQLQGLNTIGQSVNELNNLLKLPHLRGSFGEATLERLLTDLLPTTSFELQYRLSDKSQERVDAVIKYPGHVLPVDSKFPREQVLPLFEANDPSELEKARRNLADVIKIQAKQIKEKYIRPEFGTADMALLFVPSETLYFEVLRNAKLCDDLNKLKVFVVSPHTLAVALQSIATARTYYDMARGVDQTLIELKRARQHFESFTKKFDEIGASLIKATDAHQKASTHLSRFDSLVERLTTGTATDNTEVDITQAGVDLV